MNEMNLFVVISEWNEELKLLGCSVLWSTSVASVAVYEWNEYVVYEWNEYVVYEWNEYVVYERSE